MKNIVSLDDLIAKKAVEYADQIKAAAAMAHNEEEIRIESEKQLAFIQKEAGIKLEGKHEFTVASGRVDSVYDRVIIEYKNPSSAGARIGPNADSPGSKKVVEQIKKRFYDMRTQHGQALNTLFGVGLDGNRFIFVRFRDNKWNIQEPVEVNKHSAERFLWALFNLGTKGKPFSPEYLAGDFGSDAPLAREGIHALYKTIAATDNPKAQTFFSQWKILFGEVCGYDVDNPSDKIKKLAEFYGVGGKSPKSAELLFAVHTYYALFMKLMASEIVAFFHKLPTPLQKMMASTTSNKLKSEMEDLEAGSIFHHLNITNFLEGDLFAWYISVWSEPIDKLVRDMVARLDNYNPGTLSEDPASSRDLLKKLYQQLFPKSVRHDLGEYYTPDWLAEHVLNELGYVGDPDKRLLDPACGSGTFLVMAINRIRKWYDENRERCKFDEGDLCRKILDNIIGFDLNPLAVMASRTNYLIAIRDLIGRVDRIEIPVYLCDSIMTPSEYGDLFTGGHGIVKELKTAAARFMIPTEIATKRDDVAKYAEQLEFCVKNGYSPKDFIQRCQDEGLLITTKSLHTDLYCELVKLDKANKNGVWARIIKNAFAPLFIGQVDYVAGNPPWVRWSYLPSAYREDTAHLWKTYGLFTKRGIESRMGTAELDLSMLFTYASADVFLKSTNSKLGFVITKEVFKNKGAAEGFRRFFVPERNLSLCPYRADDLSLLKPFEAANKTSCIFLKKGEKPKYPVPYFVWSKKPTANVPENEMTLEEAQAHLTQTEQIANPVGEAGSAWQTMPIASYPSLEKLAGESAYKARIGARVEPYGVYWVEIVDASNPAKPLIVNLPEYGKSAIEKISPRAIEPDFLFPVLRGRDIKRWTFEQNVWAFILNKSTKREHWVEEKTMRRTWPLTFSYFNLFRDILLGRPNYWKFFGHTQQSSVPLKAESDQNHVRLKSREGKQFTYEISEAPFYSMFNIGPYTFARFRVCWSRMSNSIKASVVSEINTCLGAKQIIPTDTATIVSFDTEEEAHFFCAVVNSFLFGCCVQSFSSAGRGFGSAGILKRIRIDRFSRKDPTHLALANMSKACHELTQDKKEPLLAKREIELDELTATLWDVPKDEVEKLRKRSRDSNAPR